MPTNKSEKKAGTVRKKAKAATAKPGKREQSILDIRKKLIDQREQLLQEAGVALNTLPEENSYPDMGDQASVEVDKNFMLRLKGREKMLLNKIELAVERIDGGTYGVCDICGCDIGIKRLEARPVTTMCIDCKTEQEEEEKVV